MQRFEEGDSIRVDIPDPDDPDFDTYHGRKGEVIEVFDDDVGQHTGDQRDDVLYRIQFTNGNKMDFRWRDLRPL
jgi:ribosomal protein L21E